MKVLAIRGENLASLAGPFELDLEAEPLNGGGLFAVTGPTGAGKSTLLDALCLALYDRTPRLGGRGGTPIGYRHPRDADDLRSHDPRGLLRRGAGEGFAEVDFVGRGGRRYRATWRVRRARGRPDGRLQPQSLELRDLIDDRPLGGHTKTETLAAIERAVGLDYDAFARSVLLAQGEFATFLRADAAERAALLERLSGSALYGRISSLAHLRARQERDALKLLEARAGALSPLDAEARDRLTAERDAAAAAHDAARRELAELELRQRTLTEREAARAELEETQAGLEAARQRHAEAEPLRAAVARAERVQPLRHLHTAAEAQREAQAAAEVAATHADAAHTAAEATLTAARAEAADADAALAQARTNRETLGERLAQARALDGRLAVAEVQDARAQELFAERTRGLEAARRVLEAAEAQRAEATEALRVAGQRLNALAPDLALADAEPRWRPSLEALAEVARARASATAVRTERRVTVEAVRARDAARAEELAAAERAHAEATQALAAAPAADPAELSGLAEANARCAELARAHAALRAADDELTAAATQRTEAEAAAQRLREREDAARADLGTQRAVLREARTALTAVERTRDLAAQRADLVPDQPCPLCGATEHPYAQALPPLDAMLAEERARVADLEAGVASTAEALASLGAELAREHERTVTQAQRAERATAARAAAEARWRDLSPVDWPVVSELPADPADPATPAALDALAAALEAAEEAARDRARERAGLLARHTATEQTCTAARTQAAAARAALETCLASLAEVDAELDRCDAALAERFAELEAAWPLDDLDADSLRSDPPGFLVAAAGQAAAARSARDEAQRAERALAQAQEAAERANAEHAARRGEHAAAEAARAEAAKHLDELRRTRALVLDGDADARESEARAAERDATAAAEQHREAVGVAVRELALAAERQSHARAILAEATRRAADAEAQVQRALAEAGLDAETAAEALDRDPDWLPSTRAQLAELQSALAAAERAHALAQDHARRQTSRLVDGPEGVALSEALATARAAVETASARWAKLEGELDQDARARTQRRRLARELEAARERARPWLELGELVGSHDGSKLRNFAQSLTLEALLARANTHLLQLAPRYALERVSGQDLDLQVLDRDLGDEVRPLRSLSGGETFLVSLALALALAGVRSADTQVESLFIDEGFGTLDPASQDLALEALDALQAQGLQVGVITHVRALAERVAARVEVRPVAQGQSQIEVSGLAPLAV